MNDNIKLETFEIEIMEALNNHIITIANTNGRSGFMSARDISCIVFKKAFGHDMTNLMENLVYSGYVKIIEASKSLRYYITELGIKRIELEKELIK